MDSRISMPTCILLIFLYKENISFLQFTAPIWKGTYTFAVCLRSDSYLGFHQQKDIKLDVKEAPKHVSESEDSEEEGPIEDNAHESDYTTDEDLPDDDD